MPEMNGESEAGADPSGETVSPLDRTRSTLCSRYSYTTPQTRRQRAIRIRRFFINDPRGAVGRNAFGTLPLPFPLGSSSSGALGAKREREAWLFLQRVLSSRTLTVDAERIAGQNTVELQGSIMSNVLKYSIVVPFHNEEENVTTLYDRVKHVMEQVGDSFELVFVDDGSRDRTYRLLEDRRRRISTRSSHRAPRA